MSLSLVSIQAIQSLLEQEGVDGWLFYDFHGSNPLMPTVLGYRASEQHITRRVCYFVPVRGEPIRFVSRVEPHVLAFLEGGVEYYLSKEEFEVHMKRFSGKKIAMEYSTEIPALSLVDGGTIATLQSLGIEVHSSSNLIPKLGSILSKEQIASHRRAMQTIEEIHEALFSWLRGATREVFEQEVIAFLLKRIAEKGCTTEYDPICAVGENSANPHYSTKGRGAHLDKDKLIMVDMWCREKQPGSVYADVTRVMKRTEPTAREKKVFFAVRSAQDAAFDYIKNSQEPRGAEADRLARGKLESAGFGKYICHRLGHNITSELHGPGVNLDGLETNDDRKLPRNTIYSIEPGIYIPSEFGIRLECNVLVGEGGTEITGGYQENLIIL